jgi:hypothetical protein
MKEARPLTLLVRDAAIGRAEQRHVDRLSTVPNVEVRRVPEAVEADLVAVDALLDQLLARFGLARPPVPEVGAGRGLNRPR